MFDPLEIWAQGERSNNREKHNRVVEALNKMGTFFGSAGADVFQTLGGTSFTTPPGESFARPVFLQITDILTPGGLYVAREWGPSPRTRAEDLDPASTAATAGELLTTASGFIYYFVNLPEMESETHDLVAEDGEASGYVVGFATGLAFTDGAPLLAGFALNYKTCTPTP
jgi:hypothetical protein